MPGPGGQEAGRVSVRVLPDTSGFRQALERYLERIERTTPLQVKVNLDTGSAQEQLTRLARDRAVALDTKLDTGTAAAKLDVLSRDRTVEVKVDIDRGIQGTTSALTKAFAQFGAVGTLPALVGSFVSLRVAMVAALPSVVSLGAGLVSMTGALATLPAIAGAAGLGVGALVVGFRGFGEAMKNIGDPKAFETAIQNLAPSAAATATAIRDLVPAFTEVRKVTQEKLFSGMADQLKGLVGNYLPLFRSGLEGIATAANEGAKSAVAFLRLPQSITDTATGIGNTQHAFTALNGAIAPVLSVFRDLMAVGSSFLPGLAGGFANAAKSAAQFVSNARESGKLQEFMQAGLTAVGQLGNSLVNVGAVFLHVFEAANAAGGGFFASLEKITGALATLSASADVQQGLGALFSGISAGVSAAVSGIAGQLGPTIKALGPALGTVATQVGQVFGALAGAAGPVLQSLAPIITGIAKTLGPVLTGAFTQLGPLLAQIATLATPLASLAGTVLPPLATALGSLGPAVASIVPAFVQMAQVVGVTLSQAFTQLGPVLAQVLSTLGPAIAQSLATVAPLFLQLLDAVLPLVPPLAKLAAAVLPPLAAVLAHLGPVLQVVLLGFLAFQAIGIIAGIVTAVGTAFAALQGIFMGLSLVLAANPFVLIVLGLVALGVALVEAYKHSETFRNIVTAAFTVIRTVVETAVRAVEAVIQAVFPVIKTVVQVAMLAISVYVQTYMTIVRTVFTAVWTAVRVVVETVIGVVRTVVQAGMTAVSAVVGTQMHAVQTVVSTVWNAVRSVVTAAVAAIKAAIGGLAAIVGVVRGAFESARSAAVSILQALVAYVRGIPGQIIGALAGLGSALYTAGSKAMGMLKDGFIAGARGLVDSVKGALGGLAKFLPGSPVKEGPLTVLNNGYAGGQIVKMIADGITAKLPLLGQATTGIKNTLGSGFVDAMTGTTSQIAASSAKLVKQVVAARTIPVPNKSTIVAAIQFDTAELTKDARDRDAVLKRLATQQDNLKAMMQERAQLAASARDSAREFGSILNAVDQNSEGPTDANALIKGLQTRLQAIRDFQADLAALGKKGISADVVKQIASAGIEKGAGVADALANASKEQVAQINELNRQVMGASVSVGNSVLTSLGNAGVKAVEGLIQALRSRQGDIEAEMIQIAKGMQAAIKKALGIHSPSKVFHDIGKQIPTGLVNGIESQQHHVNRALANMAQSSSGTFSTSDGGASAQGGSPVNFYGNVGWDPNEVARRIDVRKRDALAVAGLRT